MPSAAWKLRQRQPKSVKGVKQGSRKWPRVTPQLPLTGAVRAAQAKGWEDGPFQVKEEH